MAKSHVLQIRQAKYTLSLNLLLPCANANTSCVHCGGTDFEEVNLYTDVASFFFRSFGKTWAFARAKRAKQASTPLHWRRGYEEVDKQNFGS